MEKINSIEEAINYLKENNLNFVVEAAQNLKELGVNEKLETKEPYKPDLIDLCRLHRFVIKHKRTTILEFGTGWSTLTFANALAKNKLKYANELKDLRRNNPFEIHVIDDEPDFIHLSKSRIPLNLISHVKFYESPVIMSTFNDKICTYYSFLPNISPDLIYVDGPDQFNVKSDVAGWTTRHKDLMPMAGDLLRIEHFLTPGTVIIFDGRAANARFFKSNTQRKWSYEYDYKYDQSIFRLDEEPLGRFNQKQLDFYKS